MTWFSTLLGNLSTPFKSWVTVAPWESGIRIRLGKRAVLLKPGIHFRIPFLDRVYVRASGSGPSRTRNLNAMTRAGQCVTISVAIDFAVADIRKLYDSLSTPEATLQAVVAEKVMRAVGSATSVSAEGLQEQVSSSLRGDEWGLSSMAVRIIGFAICRTFRLIQSEYSDGALLSRLDGDDGNGSGERK